MSEKKISNSKYMNELDNSEMCIYVGGDRRWAEVGVVRDVPLQCRAVGLKVSDEEAGGKIVFLKYLGRLATGSASSQLLVMVFAVLSLVPRFPTNVADMGSTAGRGVKGARPIVPLMACLALFRGLGCCAQLSRPA